MSNYSEIIRAVKDVLPPWTAELGTVCAVDKEKKKLKIIIGSKGEETGWCKCLKGAFTEETGKEVVVLAIGHYYEQYVVCGIVDD